MSTVEAEEPKASGPEDMKEFFSNITLNVQTVEAPPIWIVRLKNGHYLRAPLLNGGMIQVTDRRLATRFDSRGWAATVASFIADSAGAKIVRLWKKGERPSKTVSRVTSGAWCWKKPDDAPVTQDGTPTGSEGSKP